MITLHITMLIGQIKYKFSDYIVAEIYAIRVVLSYFLQVYFTQDITDDVRHPPMTSIQIN